MGRLRDSIACGLTRVHVKTGEPEFVNGERVGSRRFDGKRVVSTVSITSQEGD